MEDFVRNPNDIGMHEKGIVDETILSMIEGLCDEIALIDYKSLENLSADVITKCYKITQLSYGSVGPALTKRYNNLWME